MAENKEIANEKSVFETLNEIDVSAKIKTKNGFNYLSWASAWAEVKKKYPDAQYSINQQIMDYHDNTAYGFNKRFWHDDGRTGWVEVSVTINGVTQTEILAIMDFKNKVIPADQITSVDANKSIKRCLVKACALHGLGLYIFEGEDLPEETSKNIELKEKVKGLVAKKVKLSDEAKKKVAELCKAAEKQANPDFDEDLITGNYNNIEDTEVLNNLIKKLLAIRK